MKIGIITQPLHTNCGGLLQNYALQQVLKRLGHEVVTLDQSHLQSKRWRVYAACVKTFLLRLIGKGKSRIYPWQNRRISVNIEYFINKYIDRTTKLETQDEFRKYSEKENINVFIVGSDQVWRPIYNKNIFCSFLDFTEGLLVKRIAYAASFGVDYWEFTSKQTIRCKELIKKFDAVSVREDSGVELCRKYLGCNAMHVLDPTMLLDKKDYMSLIYRENNLQSKGNLFTYILDYSEEKRTIIAKMASTLNLIPFSCMLDKENKAFFSVGQWLRSFFDAEFVICDSFHGVVFSIIFNKPFLVIGNRERGMSRFTSLLKIFDLEDRLITEYEDYFKIKKIDWRNIEAKRKLLKNESIKFLESHI